MLGNNYILSNFATAYYFLRNKYCCVLRAGSWIGGWTYRVGGFCPSEDAAFSGLP